MEELKLQVVLDKKLESEVDGVVAFGDFKPKGENPLTAIYGKGEMHLFYQDLILGRPLPLVLVVRALGSMEEVLAVSLFLHRDMALSPKIPGMLAAVNLMDAYGVAGLAHVDRELSGFLKFLIKYLGNTTDKIQDSVKVAVEFVRDYVLEGRLPSLPPEPEPPRVVDRGTDGFVFAVSQHPDLLAGWEELYRQGFLRGVLVHKAEGDRWHVLAARKSTHLRFNLAKAAGLLNEAEVAMGEPEGWGTDMFWLVGPDRGTLILPSDMLQVFLRI